MFLSSSSVKTGVFSLLLGVLISISVFALVSPVKQLNGVAQRLMGQLHKNRTRLRDPKVVHSIIRRLLMPHFGQNKISASVLGGRYWANASSSQRSQFKRLFSSLVIGTYAAAFQGYNNDKVKFFPLRGGYRRRVVTVNSLLIRGNGQRIRMSYNVRRAGSRWKIYDFSIAGVSMVQSYRAQFSGVLAKLGLPGLIARLRSRR